MGQVIPGIRPRSLETAVTQSEGGQLSLEAGQSLLTTRQYHAIWMQYIFPSQYFVQNIFYKEHKERKTAVCNAL